MSKILLADEPEQRQGGGSPIMLPCWLRRTGKQGRPVEGLKVVTEAIASVQIRLSARYYEAELHRIKGELLLTQAAADEQQAEACFQNALKIARGQSAKSLELRAAMSLSRLWQRQGKKAEAQRLLAEIYGWFTEGFDTADLKQAKTTA